MPNEIKIANLDAFLASVKEAQRECANLSEPLRDIGEYWMRSNKAYFAQGPGFFEDLSGSKPRRNATSGRFQSQNGGYKAQKLKRWGFVYPILKASGDLERSMTVPGDKNSLFEIKGGTTIRLGTKVVGRGGANYPAFLNYGTSRMKARPFLDIPEITVARWIKVLRTFIVGRAAGTGSQSKPGG